VENKTLTDEIYAELVDGLKTGLDWTQFLAKHGASKGPLYNAIGRFFNDMEAKVRALSEVQAKLDAAGLELDSLDQKIKEAEGSLAPLEDRRNALNDQVKTLETRLAEKSELAGHLVELGKLGFDIERLKQLREALTEIGAKHGFKGKEAVSKFFDDLKDYDARIGFEREIQRLETITGTKKLEAEKWQAEADSLARRHKDLSEAITAAQTLIKHGVNIEQIVSWNGIVSKLGGAEALQDKLGEYKSMSELLNARKEEAEAYGLRLTKAQSQLETLQKERAKIEAAIDALKVAGVKKLQAMAEATEKQLKAVAASEIREAQAVGQEVRSEFVNYFAQLDKLLEKAVHLGQELERSKQELQRYEGVKDALESHAVAAEAEK
jgi:chromosome segregation ATPase